MSDPRGLIVTTHQHAKERSTMYITALNITFAPGHTEETVTNVPLTILQGWSGIGSPEIKGFATLFATKYDLGINWDTWVHSEQTRTGSIDFTDPNDEGENVFARANWRYDPLDDPDNSELFALPELFAQLTDHKKYATGVLTPEQHQAFWACVNPELQPLQHLDDTLGAVPFSCFSLGSVVFVFLSR